MTQNLRQIKLRIKSVAATQRITRAMEMVSAAKLNRTRNAYAPAKAYLADLESMFLGLHADAAFLDHPLLKGRYPVKSIVLCVVTSDTGLCGSYNHNVLKAAEGFLEDNKEYNVQLIAVGKEASSHFEGKAIILNSYHGLYGRYSDKLVETLTNELVNIYTAEEADQVYLAYTHFSPTLRHKPVVERFLSLDWQTGSEMDHIYEPTPAGVFEAMLPVYLLARIQNMILEAFTSEHSARMLAMKTATDNADELIETLTLLRNKVRQFAITKEVLEIAMSAEALKEG